MKPTQIRSEKKRKEAVRLRKFAQRIPDNKNFSDLLLFQFPERAIRAEAYKRFVPLLRFKALPLEDIENGLT